MKRGLEKDTKEKKRNEERKPCGFFNRQRQHTNGYQKKALGVYKDDLKETKATS